MACRHEAAPAGSVASATAATARARKVVSAGTHPVPVGSGTSTVGARVATPLAMAASGPEPSTTPTGPVRPEATSAPARSAPTVAGSSSAGTTSVPCASGSAGRSQGTPVGGVAPKPPTTASTLPARLAMAAGSWAETTCSETGAPRTPPVALARSTARVTAATTAAPSDASGPAVGTITARCSPLGAAPAGAGAGPGVTPLPEPAPAGADLPARDAVRGPGD